MISISTRETDEPGQVEIQISYPENENIEYFILEYWDDAKRRFVPYDGRHGILKILSNMPRTGA